MDEEKKSNNKPEEYNENHSEEELENQEDIQEDIIEKNPKTIEDENENETEKSTSLKKKRNIIIGSIVSGIFLFVLLINVFVFKYDNLVYPGVTLYGEDISKFNEEDVVQKLNEVKSKIENNKIAIKASGKSYYISINEIILNYNINELSKEIMKYGKDENILTKFNQIVTKKNKDFTYTFEVKKNNIENVAKEISEKTDKSTKEPQVIIDGDKLSYVEGENGLKLDEKALNDDINKILKDKSIVSGNANIEVNYKIDKPTIAISELKKANEKISTYTTTYSPSGGRGSNVENAAKKLDNMILMPGQEFSYEKSVGPVIQSNGYTYAPVISNGQMVQGIGGGVCQVSSTLYNTMLKSGILPTERRNHSKAVSYVPRGLDATLASGSIDYKFKNTFDYPVIINTNCSGGELTIEFWSNEKALNGIEYKPVSYARGKTADTFLYGYDKNGNKVYEKHIDTSVYR